MQTAGPIADERRSYIAPRSATLLNAPRRSLSIAPSSGVANQFPLFSSRDRARSDLARSPFFRSGTGATTAAVGEKAMGPPMTRRSTATQQDVDRFRTALRPQDLAAWRASISDASSGTIREPVIAVPFPEAIGPPLIASTSVGQVPSPAASVSDRLQSARVAQIRASIAAKRFETLRRNAAATLQRTVRPLKPASIPEEMPAIAGLPRSSSPTFVPPSTTTVASSARSPASTMTPTASASALNGLQLDEAIAAARLALMNSGWRIVYAEHGNLLKRLLAEYNMRYQYFYKLPRVLARCAPLAAARATVCEQHAEYWLRRRSEFQGLLQRHEADGVRLGRIEQAAVDAVEPCRFRVVAPSPPEATRSGPRRGSLSTSATSWYSYSPSASNMRAPVASAARGGPAVSSRSRFPSLDGRDEVIVAGSRAHKLCELRSLEILAELSNRQADWRAAEAAMVETWQRRIEMLQRADIVHGEQWTRWIKRDAESLRAPLWAADPAVVLRLANPAQPCPAPPPRPSAAPPPAPPPPSVANAA